MKIALTGTSGLLGRALVARLRADGHDVWPLVRRPVAAAASAVFWDPSTGQIDKPRLEGLDACIHLAGENLADGRWTAAKKAAIRDSRVNGTALLGRTFAALQKPPPLWLSASAVGFYGSRGEETLTEDSPPGSGFLADVCQGWESAAHSAPLPQTRVVHLRTGVVLSAAGGALQKMLLPFQLGLGGRIGNGQPYMSWITLDDWVSAVLFLLTRSDFSGPVNVVSPQPVSNFEFTKTLGRALHRPTIFPVPAFLARLVFGEMADETLLASTRVIPKRLLEVGFVFQHPTLEEALAKVVKKCRVSERQASA